MSLISDSQKKQKLRHKKSGNAQKAKIGKTQSNKQFWDKEYRTSAHLNLSVNPSEEVIKFLKFVEKDYNGLPFEKDGTVLDLGCGNGRNLRIFVKELGMRGIGFDISSHATKQARMALAGTHSFIKERSIAGDFSEIENKKVDIVLDLMSSHFLRKAEREHMLSEIVRVLKDEGFYLLKTFLRDGDLHTPRLLRDYPADEPGSYIHPQFGLFEYVWWEEDLIEFLSPYFDIKHIERSHQHKRNGEAFKRRFIAIILQKKRGIQ